MAPRLPGKWSYARFNAHSLATATCSDLIVRSRPTPDSEWAFVAGLLHDIGLLLLAAGLPGYYTVVSEGAENDFDLVQREQELLGFTHFDVGTELLARWNLPLAVQTAIRHCTEEHAAHASPLDLAAVLRIATAVADASGMSIFESKPDRE